MLLGSADENRLPPSRPIVAREAGDRLAAAGTGGVPTEEGVVRAIRALVGVGDYLVVLSRARVSPEPEEFERRVAAPLRALIENGQTAGAIRADMPASWLTEALVGLVISVSAAAPAAA